MYESVALSESLVSRRAETFGSGGLVVKSIMKCMTEMNGCMDRERVGNDLKIWANEEKQRFYADVKYSKRVNLTFEMLLV